MATRNPNDAPRRRAPVREDERPGLQALVRGAAEAAALLPVTSSRFAVAVELHDSLVEILAGDDER